MKPPKILIVGWDGATWDVLEPLLAEGNLPTLAHLRERGAWGELLSTDPPVTAPAWSTFATGMTPSRHGLLSWQMPLGQDGSRRWVSARDLAAPTLWRLLSDVGHRVCVVNMPLSYPPEPVNGVLIGGMLTPNAESQFTYPAEVRQELLASVPDYRPDVEMQETERNVRTPDGIASFLEEVRISVFQREAAFEVAWARGSCDVAFVMFEASDRLQHPLWQYAVGCPATGDGRGDATWQATRAAVADGFGALDAALARLLVRCDEETAVFLISDHGFGPLRAILHLNDWLAAQGWLTYAAARTSIRTALRRTLGPLRRHLPGLLRRRARAAFSPLQMLEWERTVAYAGLPTEDGIWLNVKGREPWGVVEKGQEYESLREEIIQSLTNLRHPTTGEPLVSWAKRREEIHPGDYACRAPDIMLQFAPGIKMTPASGDGQLVEDVEHQGRGHHRREGILVAAGPSVRPGPVDPASLADVAPTVLALLGHTVPGEMDGHVLRPLFDIPDASIYSADGARRQATEPVASESGYTEEEERQITERLSGLGYLD